MSRRFLNVTVSVAALLVAGLLVPATASAAEDGDCAGMSVPAAPVAPVAPAPVNDTVTVLAGGTVFIPVLANDPANPNPVSVVTTSFPTYGGTCVDSSGTVEYFADLSSTSHTDTFIYYVSDGYYIRPATVTVNVTGVAPVNPTVVKKARNGKKASLSFTNANASSVLIRAGSPKKRRPDVKRTVAGHGSTVIKNGRPKVFYVVTTFDALGNEIPISFGTVNTRTGKVKAANFADERTRAIAKRWIAAGGGADRGARVSPPRR
ncbi:MAG: hypothetical protein JWO46_339 [Nocardioidaceae bacterium]|nr:hypothetical protein [Nocardioidaceae bacterium]